MTTTWMIFIYCMSDFIRFESSENIFYALKNEKNNIKSFPSIERDLFLKSAIKNCFDYLKELLRTNRNDFNTGPIKKYIPISFIRKTIDEGVDNIKYTHEINTIEKQEIFSNLIADVYTKYEGDKEAFCNENVYLFFNKMCLEGINKDLIRVVRFYNYDNYNDHVIILYSSAISLFNKIENYCNFDVLNINQGSQQSYLNLVDILMEAKREGKENQLIIIDP
ncbi:hypothetical protein SGGMMB4_02252 [Sodalis glossinidius str. 'morsitans']|uniref:Uncharacterized protein n=1 Tax=Sodalis glossinidius (strain morsitans) TaxID=343509 RepID=Q2NU90_SODGM|nr:hypothetical protein [Sodalis glossinidius]BAE74285.1 hypothetical protein SG1010 [Sodalis glossinidius str. 'morsitans']CRL44878.1 hypothetical protein SGGMMB4_02252 [Sodalis glossinidius str. 'morsitans']